MLSRHFLRNSNFLLPHNTQLLFVAFAKKRRLPNDLPPEQKPGTVVVRRVWDVTKMEGNTGRPKIGWRNRVYQLTERRLGPTNLEVILTEDIEGVGVEGETINPPKEIGRHLIHTLGKALYASPENRAQFGSGAVKSKKQSVTGRKMRLWLQAQPPLVCHVRSDAQWSLSQKLLCRLLQKDHGLIVDESSVKLPEYEITNENLNPEEAHTVKITVNGIDVIPVEVKISPKEFVQL